MSKTLVSTSSQNCFCLSVSLFRGFTRVSGTFETVERRTEGGFCRGGTALSQESDEVKSRAMIKSFIFADNVDGFWDGEKGWKELSVKLLMKNVEKD